MGQGSVRGGGEWLVGREVVVSEGRGMASMMNLEHQPRSAGPSARSPGTVEGASDRLAAVVQQCGHRRRLPARDRLFAAGEPARHYIKVSRGQLLAHCRSARGAPSVRMLSEGDVFIFDCGDKLGASCDAIPDCELIVAERRLVETEALHDRDLAQELRELHARELQMFLAALRYEDRLEPDLDAAIDAAGNAYEAPLKRRIARPERRPQPVTRAELLPVRRTARPFWELMAGITPLPDAPPSLAARPRGPHG